MSQFLLSAGVPATRFLVPGGGVLLGDGTVAPTPHAQLLGGTMSPYGVVWQPIVPPTSLQQPNCPPAFSSCQPHQDRVLPGFSSAIQLSPAGTTTTAAAAVAAPEAWGALAGQVRLPTFALRDGCGGGSPSDPSFSGLSMASLQSTGAVNHPPSSHTPVVAPSSDWSSGSTAFPAKLLPPPPSRSYVPQHPGIHTTTGPRIIGGRLRTGSNVHTALRDVCQYFSYHDPLPVRDASCEGPGAQVVPLFVQMYPYEHMENAQVIFDAVMCLICGPGAGRAVGVEQRSDTSFLVHVQTGVVWHVLYNLRCRVLMDRHGFWYAGSLPQYLMMREYCDRLRNLPQHARHAAADGMPSLPLVVELARSVQQRTISAPSAPAPFDAQVPR